MNSPPREWLTFLRGQFPVGSRIRLTRMNDPIAPVEPGTMGTLMVIDDQATFHCTWDNGRTLGLVLGEDVFSVLPPETHLLKLYMPMTVDYYEHDSWRDYENDPCEMSDAEAASFADSIAVALMRERQPEEAERGLMEYYDRDDAVDRKVRSFTFTAEARNGKLWGVAECQVQGELTPKELAALKEYISGQASDGFGEGFEQREIRLPDGREVYAHLWQYDDWSIKTEQERFSPSLAEGLPELCFSTLQSTGELICIKRGESGYYPSDWNTDYKEQNVELADYNNERLGVTPEQRQAMEVGSMAGWDAPGADPANYGEHFTQIGGMTFE